MNAEHTGRLIQRRRLEKHMTQQELAEALHVSNRTVSKWECGKGFPDISLLEPLSGILELSVASLLAGAPVTEPVSELSLRQVAGAFRRQLRQVTFRQVLDVAAKLLMLLGVLALILLMLDYRGVFNQKISLEVPVGIYSDGEQVGESTVTIEGEIGRIKTGRSFVGHFAIGYVERSCRDTVKCWIGWDEAYGGQSIQFYEAGMLYLASEFGLHRELYISPDMRSFALKMLDGTVIATDASYVPLMDLDYYYSLDFKSVGIFP